MSDWITSPLAEVLAFREGPGIMSESFRDAGVPLVRLSGLKRGADIFDGCNHLDPDDVAHRWKRFRLEAGDVLLSTSASLGEVAVVPDRGAGSIPYTGIVAFRPKDGRVDSKFIPFLLTDPRFKEQIEALGVGSVMRHFGPSHLRQMQVSFPPIQEQRAIVEVLGALDDKVEANTAMLRTVDGLVRARYEGLVGNVGGTARLSEVAVNVRIQSQPSDQREHALYVGLEHVGRRLMWLTDWGSSASVTSAKYVFQAGDVLFGKLRPYFHKVAYAPAVGVCSTEILVVRAKDRGLSGLVLACCASDEAVAKANAASEGTRMPRAKWADLTDLEVPDPTHVSTRAFSRSALELADLCQARVTESHALGRMRDALLPVLMSGRLRVKDAEKMVEEVV